MKQEQLLESSSVKLFFISVFVLFGIGLTATNLRDLTIMSRLLRDHSFQRAKMF